MTLYKQGILPFLIGTKNLHFQAGIKSELY